MDTGVGQKQEQKAVTAQIKFKVVVYFWRKTSSHLPTIEFILLLFVLISDVLSYGTPGTQGFESLRTEVIDIYFWRRISALSSPHQRMPDPFLFLSQRTSGELLNL